MSAALVSTPTGGILFSSGDIDAPYGIASLSKIWAIVLLCDRIKLLAHERKVSLDTILDESISCAIDYEAKIYKRMDARLDLSPPDDPLTYQPFRSEKMRFRLPVENGKSYKIRDLFEAALFQSKNDALQALADHFFGDADNIGFQAASKVLAHKLGLSTTKIGNPHGLCDGDNVSSARELNAFYSFIVQEGFLGFFGRFRPAGKEHTAQSFLDDPRLAQKDIEIMLVKTATGSDRRGNDGAESAMTIAKIDNQLRIALALSDPNRFETLIDLLGKKSL